MKKIPVKKELGNTFLESVIFHLTKKRIRYKQNPKERTRLIDFATSQMVKHLPTIRETRIWSLGREDPLEKEMATHSSTLPGKSRGQRSVIGYSPWGCKELDTTERLHFFTFTVAFYLIWLYFLCTHIFYACKLTVVVEENGGEKWVPKAKCGWRCVSIWRFCVPGCISCLLF